MTTADHTNFVVEAQGVSGDSAFELLAPLSTDLSTGKAFSIRASGESFGRAMIYTDGKIGLGGGAGARDSFYFSLGSKHDSNFFGYAGAANLVANGNIGVDVVDAECASRCCGRHARHADLRSNGNNCKTVSGGWGAGGSVTNISAGTGLTGGNISTTGTLNRRRGNGCESDRAVEWFF